jgi:hypothetical protein
VTTDPSRSPRLLTALAAGLGLAALATALLVGAGGPAGFPFLLGASAAFLLAVVHRWRSPRKFLFLAAGSALGFVVFALLHNVFYALGELSAASPVLVAACEALHVSSFLLAVAACPVGVLVGLAGALVTGLRGGLRGHA